MDLETAGRIIGKPTLLVTYESKLDPEAVLGAIGGLGYPLSDVSVYYRVVGTDQVLDATTGQAAAGQALAAEVSRGKTLDKLETLVLLHPNAEQFVALQGALRTLGNADIKYAEQSISGEEPGGETVPPAAPQAE
jgi:hypothetical protein